MNTEKVSLKSKGFKTLNKWLCENNFSRPNFSIIKLGLENGVDYVTIGSKYFIHEENAKKKIMETDWDNIIKKSKEGK